MERRQRPPLRQVRDLARPSKRREQLPRRRRLAPWRQRASTRSGSDRPSALAIPSGVNSPSTAGGRSRIGPRVVDRGREAAPAAAPELGGGDHFAF